MIHSDVTIRTALTAALTTLGIEGVEPQLEHPGDLAHGDWSTNVALAAAKLAQKSPRALADELVAALGTVPGVAKLEVAGPGFINFYLDRTFFSTATADIAAIGKDWGKGASFKGRKMVIEYSCTNPFKEMHMGHFMSTVIGEAVSRLATNAGATVIRDSYGGDVGPHVAKVLWSLRKNPVELTAATISEAYAAGARAYEEDVAAKAEMDALNVEIYKGEDAELMKLWADARKVTVDAFNAIYKSLDISFDRFFYESEVMQLGMEKVEEGKAKGILLESENAVIYPGNEEKHFPPLVFVTSRGTPTYEAKDLGLAVLKDKEFSNAEWYILTAAEQIGHFQVVKAVLGEIDGALGARLNHVPHGMLLLPEGKMSSRTGNVLTAEKLIELTNAKASEKSEDAEVAEQVGVGALKYVVLRSKPGSNVVFDLAQALSHEGDSGPYLQYSLARANSILSKAKDEGIHPSAAILPESVIELERVLYRFPEVAERAAREFEPHYVTTYLTELSGLFNSWYATGKIIDAADPHSPYKLLITEAFATTMKNGLQLLGISTPERM